MCFLAGEKGMEGSNLCCGRILNVNFLTPCCLALLEATGVFPYLSLRTTRLPGSLEVDANLICLHAIAPSMHPSSLPW